MKSVMTNQFSKTPSVQVPRSQFDRSHGFKATFNAGDLIPIFVDEVLPGDTFNVREHLFGRFNTPLKPIMDNMFLDTQYFFVPNRLLWENWEKFNGAQDNPGDSVDFLVPQMPAPSGGFSNSTLVDYMGVPTDVENININSLHTRAYNLIWNEWYRDENLQDSIVVDTDDGPDLNTDYVIQKRGKRYDYFTSCLPFPQKGDAVQLPLGEFAPVITNESVPTFSNLGQTVTQQKLFNNTSSGLGASNSNAYATLGNDNIIFGNESGLRTDLAQATAANINQIREAFQIQKLLERDARGGTRYVETIKAHFGVTSPDYRLQRPEYLGGGTSSININPVQQTSESSVDSPQGNLAAFGTVSSNGKGFTKSFTEHGVIVGLASVRADLTYQQGLNRMWSRQTRYDFFWPVLGNLGEQAVLNREIFAQGTSADEEVFGYQERYGEYRYKPSTITSQFRSNFAQSLDLWHLSQDFASLPVLNDEFIQEDPPIARVVAVPSEPDFILDAYFQCKTARPMPLNGVPGLVDHF